MWITCQWNNHPAAALLRESLLVMQKPGRPEMERNGDSHARESRADGPHGLSNVSYHRLADDSIAVLYGRPQPLPAVCCSKDEDPAPQGQGNLAQRGRAR